MKHVCVILAVCVYLSQGGWDLLLYSPLKPHYNIYMFQLTAKHKKLTVCVFVQEHNPKELLGAGLPHPALPGFMEFVMSAVTSLGETMGRE